MSNLPAIASTCEPPMDSKWPSMFDEAMCNADATAEKQRFPK
jgi:hypothetical protein